VFLHTAANRSHYGPFVLQRSMGNRYDRLGFFGFHGSTDDLPPKQRKAIEHDRKKQRSGKPKRKFHDLPIKTQQMLPSRVTTLRLNDQGILAEVKPGP
jgi:hypothetical protein